MEQRAATLEETIVLSRSATSVAQRRTVQQVRLLIANDKGVSARENHPSELLQRLLFEGEFDRVGF